MDKINQIVSDSMVDQELEMKLKEALAAEDYERAVQIRDMLRAGISFPDALREIRLSTDNRILVDALAQITQAITRGKDIAASFALFPNLFSEIFIAIVSGGEKSGSLDDAFDYLARYLTNNAALRERLLRSLRYPVFLLCIAGGAVAFLMTAVVPQIVLFMNEIDASIPLPTRVLINLSSFMTAYGFIILGTIIASTALLVGAYHTSAPFAVASDRLLLKIPMIGPTLLKAEMCRFAQNFSLLYKSGYPAVACLSHARDTFDNRALGKAIYDAERLLTEGAALSAALEGILPPYAVGVLRIGERSGNLEKSFNDIMTTYERESTEAMDSFIGMLEPGLTLTLGALLAWTVLAVLGPLYDSLSVLGGQP